MPTVFFFYIKASISFAVFLQLGAPSGGGVFCCKLALPGLVGASLTRTQLNLYWNYPYDFHVLLLLCHGFQLRFRIFLRDDVVALAYTVAYSYCPYIAHSA